MPKNNQEAVSGHLTGKIQVEFLGAPHHAGIGGLFGGVAVFQEKAHPLVRLGKSAAGVLSKALQSAMRNASLAPGAEHSWKSRNA
jgi:hypothetical protein